MKTSLSSSLRVAGLALAAVGLTQTSASAQAFDAQVGFIEVSQALSTTNYTAGRSTYVRVEALLTNPPSNPVDLDGIMRVFVNGVEASNSPVYSQNGPFEAKTNPNFNVKKGTLNFMYLPPDSNNVVFTIELNPAGPNFVPEGNTTNNTKSTPVLNFQERAVPDFAYAPIDYQGPTGGCCATGLPNESLIEPGVGDNFIQGIYPSKDIYYHRIDAPSKTWSQNLASSGSGLLNSLQQNWFQMSPRPDFLYGWVPGSLPGYNGQAFLNSAISMGNTQSIRHQRTYAHEVGHNVGLNHTNWNIINRGVDSEHHLNLTEGLPFIKVASLRNIMDAGLLTDAAWVRDTHYDYFFNHSKFANPAPSAPTAPALAITGLWTAGENTLTIDGLFEVDPVQPSVSVDPQTADFEISVYRGGDLAQRLYMMSPTVTDSCAAEQVESEDGETATDSWNGVPDLAFNAVIPHGGQAFDRLVIHPIGRVQAEPMVLDRSPNPPEIQFVTPGPGGNLDSAQFQLSWIGSDADGDELTYYVRYSRDGIAWTPLAAAITETTLDVDLTELPALVNGVGFIEVQAVDGLNMTVMRSPSLVVPGSVSNLLVNDPWVHVSTPDSGKSFPKAADVVLHAQGWDLEDRGLDDADMAWTSDLDGAIGTGRLLATTSLSLGTHVLTVTGTDSDGRTASATTTITIDDRGLPGEPTGGVTFYCTPGVSANGCQGTLSAVGTASATAPTGFTVTASTVEGAKQGLFFYGTNGPQANNWGNGTSFQCVVPPTIRTPAGVGSGTAGACDGSAAIDLNALWTAVPVKNPGSGATVNMQYWYRDPANTSNQTTSLTNAAEFVVQP